MASRPRNLPHATSSSAAIASVLLGLRLRIKLQDRLAQLGKSLQLLLLSVLRNPRRVPALLPSKLVTPVFHYRCEFRLQKQGGGGRVQLFLTCASGLIDILHELDAVLISHESVGVVAVTA